MFSHMYMFVCIVFEMFLDFPKPIIVAANGPAIGIRLTSTIYDMLFA